MAKRRHGPNRQGIRRLTILLVAVGVVVVALAGAAFAGYRYDRARANRFLPGVHIAGVDVGGMSRLQAERALAGTASAILDRSIGVTAGTHSWKVSPRTLGTRVDVTGAVDRAMAASNAYAWPARLYHRLLNKPVVLNVALPVSYDDAAMSSFVHQAAGQVSGAPRDATLDFVDGRLIRQHARVGQTLRTTPATSALVALVKGTGSSITLPVVTVKPKVTDKSLGLTILVRISQNKLYLYRGLKLIKTYQVATGQLGIFPTPQGHFEVINKVENPTWINPAPHGWGAGEPAQIGPGPGNPLGTRAMYLSAPGIRIHGTPDDASIGHWASHGCIRMHIPESEQLFNIVQIGTPVIITW
jgi:lipoprotein-anchoring transpeptidase ErfK/SrfK